MNFDADRLSRLSGLGPVEDTGILTESADLNPVDVLSEEGDEEIEECCGCGNKQSHSHGAHDDLDPGLALFEVTEDEDDTSGVRSLSDIVPPEAEARAEEVSETNTDRYVDHVLGYLGEGGKILQRGSKGKVVKALQFVLAKKLIENFRSGTFNMTDNPEAQTALIAMMHAGGFDGDFGPKTEAAVKALQDIYDISVDGKVGKDTFGKLFDIEVDLAAESAPLTMEALRVTVLELRDEILAEQAEAKLALTEAPARTAIRREIQALLAEMPADAATNWIYGKKGKPSSAHNKSKATALAGVGFANSKN
jgi:peptidoglycan hydrolase-like protein with peptidoglycan-binding domain